MNKTNLNDSTNTVIEVSIMLVLAIIAFNFLSPWFTSFGMFFKLLLTWVACDYLYNCIKDIYRLYDKEVNNDSKVTIEINKVTQPTKRGKKKD